MIFYFKIMGPIISDALQKNHLTANQVSESGLMDKATIRKILTGESVNTKFYDRLLKWLEENYPKVYKEVVNSVIENLNKFKMD